MRHLQGFINYTIHGNVGSYLDVIRAATRIQISVPHSCVQPAAAMANQQAGPALPAFVYRISTADEWAELQRAGATLGGDLDRSTGCIHLSDISQVSPNPNTAWFPPAYALPNFTKFVKSYYPAWTDLGCYFFSKWGVVWNLGLAIQFSNLWLGASQCCLEMLFVDFTHRCVMLFQKSNPFYDRSFCWTSWWQYAGAG